MKSTLYYGGNRYIMREHISDESGDRVCLDPRINSTPECNALFKRAKRHEGP